ncbi:hypothetical protein HKK60_01200 [Stenotrophomonas maltophilia]|uniref:hypothetical protein n=1 Tax=Stenotrophomonas maltophilia TaxID=40324 RepID=UPI0014638873|nr:hypothetical protein [Stenotrophomonas maltophilia]QJP18207.1 hypothetical protein HKK60_01200 [Stenotrophomonas maltophilia]
MIAKVALALDLGLSPSASVMKHSILVTSAPSLANCHSAARHATRCASAASFSMIRIRQLDTLSFGKMVLKSAFSCSSCEDIGMTRNGRSCS